jgi:cyclic beta-1,2-glucan synthetase
MGEAERAEELLHDADAVREAIEANAWDGGWYRRGYYDDGSPLGSAKQDECRIDSIAQSWAVLSGAGDQGRARLAMQAVRRDLVRERESLILLFTPPFDRSAQDPGYVRAYPPGVRENGGQYTHAAVWTVWALAQIGEGDLAARLFTQLLPVRRSLTPETASLYRVEPYVMAADVYGEPARAGRGGWTWYTGSAGWAYRFGWEVLLGLRLENDTWRLDPHVPRSWPAFEITLRDGDTIYRLRVDNPHGSVGRVKSIRLDGKMLEGPTWPRLHDGRAHSIEATLGSAAESPEST